MEKFNAWKILALPTLVFFVGCSAPTPDTKPGSSDSNTAGTSNATSGAGTGTGGTNK